MFSEHWTRLPTEVLSHTGNCKTELARRAQGGDVSSNKRGIGATEQVQPSGTDAARRIGSRGVWEPKEVTQAPGETTSGRHVRAQERK